MHAISRGGRLPHVHADVPGLAAVPDVESWGFTLDELRTQVTEHLRSVERATGDWRQAVDGLRVHTPTLWGRLDEADREEFLREDASRWNVLRHRMAPESRAELDALMDAGRLSVGAARIETCEPLPRGGLRVTLTDGTVREVGWVINCTGPDPDARRAGGPLIEDILRSRPGGALAMTATAGMGFRTDRGRLVDANGFKTVDVVSIAPDNPQKEAMRAKFLDEHFHKEDEVRFFVAGSGLFTLHVGGKVYEVLCEQGDLIAVPDGTTHWFDMGPEPSFVAIRFFTEPDGWVGHFTGTDIAGKFPRYEPEAA